MLETGSPATSPTVPLVTATVARLPVIDAAARAAIAAGPDGGAEHARQVAACRALHAVEVVPPPRAVPPLSHRARIVFWNAERLKHGEASAALLGGLGADVVLLCEVDVGMARSGQRHAMADLAGVLGAGYAYGVEFLELGLGDAREREWHAGQTNEVGFHGAGILSRHALHRPALIRLETGGRWFGRGDPQRRVGGRMAVAAQVVLGGTPVTLVTAHLESHSDPSDRAHQMATLLHAIDAYDPAAPVVLGGDFNTGTTAREESDRPGWRDALHGIDPTRFVDPVPYEPLFGVAEARGYRWDRANVAGAATQRTLPDGAPRPPFAKLDWVFCQGLEAFDPAVVPAVDGAGQAISDHEALAVTVAHGGR
ncbi:MAG: endonuclease/exonuclease/phosphatase family protein [Inquilinaceae bacterium]